MAMAHMPSLHSLKSYNLEKTLLGFVMKVDQICFKIYSCLFQKFQKGKINVSPIQNLINSHMVRDAHPFNFFLIKTYVHQPHLFSIIITYAFHSLSPSHSFSMILPFFMFDQKYLCGEP
jgi:hypothetical protein